MSHASPIPAFNEERLLGQSLAQIKSAANVFSMRGWEVELVVCDNNSTDRTAEIARAAGTAVVFEPFNQIARARSSQIGQALAIGRMQNRPPNFTKVLLDTARLKINSSAQDIVR